MGTLREQRTSESGQTHQRPLFYEIFHPLSRRPPGADGGRLRSDGVQPKETVAWQSMLVFSVLVVGLSAPPLTWR